MFVDAHCHINSLTEEKIEYIVSSCQSGYVFVDSSIDLPSSAKSLKISDKYPFIYSAIGFHPFSAKEFNDSTIESYKNVLRQSKKIIAIGEIGLDEFADAPFKDQETIFCCFLELAREFNLPVVIHNRVSDRNIFGILDKYFKSYEKIIFHCFSYSKDFLKEITDRGGYVSFSLNILRKKKDITESLKVVSMKNILLETDSPYMKINREPSSPLDIKAVYAFAAETKNIGVKELEDLVAANAQKIFPIK